ncbi:hypothetical protein [Citrobacter portucalensis]|uniref:hypothetical protein n=1 Tax=Citrobacter portucalensis TaxID=1639133 RepID=UPI001A1FBF77|nr:hypothetical protein [Citrobacter portucalensis]
MTALNKQALRVPERKRHDWSQAVMRDCDFCSQWALTVKHDDGGHICASCCDAEYTSELKCALESAIDRAEAAEKRIAEQREYYEGVIADGSRRMAELEAKIETADKLQDSAFRHGLQHGFSYGQTNDQAGYEQCLKSYSSRGKDNG